MSNIPIKSFWGSINVNAFGKIYKLLKGTEKIKNTEAYGEDLYIDATEWDNGEISITVFDNNTRTKHRLGSLKPSKYQPR